MSDFLTVGQVAQRLRVKPKAISQAIYDCKIDRNRCPLVSGRRLIPIELFDELKAMLGNPPA